MTHLPVEQPPVMRGRFRVALTGLHIEGIRTVGRCNNRHNSGDLLRLRGIDGFDIGMRVRRTEHDKYAGVLRHIVLHKDFLAADQLRSVHLLGRLSDNAQMRTERRCCLRCIGTVFDHLPCQAHGKVIMFITGIPDKDSGHRILDLLPCRRGKMNQQPRQHQGRGRCIVRALHQSCIDHRLLHHGHAVRSVLSVELQCIRQRFLLCVTHILTVEEGTRHIRSLCTQKREFPQAVRRHKISSFRQSRGHKVRINRHSVHQDRVTAAESLIVIRITYGRKPMFKKKVAQRFGSISLIAPFNMIDP